MKTLADIRKHILKKQLPVIRIKKADSHPMKYFGTIISNCAQMPIPNNDEYSWYGKDRIRFHFKGHINIYVDAIEVRRLFTPRPYDGILK